MMLPVVNWVVNAVPVPVTIALLLVTDAVPCNPAGIVTAPLAVQVNVFDAIAQLIVPLAPAFVTAPAT